MPPHPASPALDALLARRPDDLLWLGPTELSGFFFAVAAAPEFIAPSEWMPVVFGDQGPDADSVDELNAAVQPLFGIYNEAAAMARSAEEPALPPWVEVREPPEANVGGDAPLARWARGFRYGHHWLSELWDEELPPEVGGDWGAALTCLSFFGLDERLPELMREMLPERSVAEVAGIFVRGMSEALRTYAEVGRVLEQVNAFVEDEELDATDDAVPEWSPLGLRSAASSRATSAPVSAFSPGAPGRNAPCPCGSGRKFKRCCGKAVH